MPASDVPGWQLGYRFNAANYSGGAFADLTGNGNPMEVITGAPVFETVDGHDGVKLDNTWHARFWHPNAWQGTIVLVARLQRVATGTITRWPIGFERNGSTGNNNRLSAVFFSLNRTLNTVSTGGVAAGIDLGDSAIRALALCQDQTRQNTFVTFDGVTVTAGTAGTATDDGQRHEMGSEVDGAYFGALLGNTANTTEETGVLIHFYEMHVFEANPIEDAATEMQGFLSELTAAYA